MRIMGIKEAATAPLKVIFDKDWMHKKNKTIQVKSRKLGDEATRYLDHGMSCTLDVRLSFQLLFFFY